MALDAAAAFAGRVALGKQAVALALAGEYALAHHLYRALAGLDVAYPPLHDFALLGGLMFEGVQLHKPLLAGGGDGLQFLLRLCNGLRERFERFAQFRKARLIALCANEVDVDVQKLQFVAQRQVFARRLALFFERLHARFQFGKDVLDAGEVLPRVLHAALGVQFAGLVLDDARRLLEDLAPVLRAHGEDVVDAALTDEGIALLADARIAEKVHDVAQAAGGAVELVFALAAAVDAAGDFDFGKIHRQRLVLVVERQRHFAKRQAAALLRAVEDDVLHLRAAQRLGALLAQHPAHRIGDVGLAAPVRADNAGDAVFKCHLHAVRKGLEPVEHQFL